MIDHVFTCLNAYYIYVQVVSLIKFIYNIAYHVYDSVVIYYVYIIFVRSGFDNTTLRLLAVQSFKHSMLRVQRSEQVSSRTACLDRKHMETSNRCCWWPWHILTQDELAGGKINLKGGQELKLVTDYSFKVPLGFMVSKCWESWKIEIEL